MLYRHHFCGLLRVVILCVIIALAINNLIYSIGLIKFNSCLVSLCWSLKWFLWSLISCMRFSL